MVTLDDFASNVQALNAVGIYRALCQPLGVSNLLGFSIEHLHKVATDNLALLLWLCHSLKVLEELIACIHANHVQPQTFVVAHHVLEFVLAQHTMIYEYASQLLADGSVQQHSSHATVHTSRETEDYAVVAYLLFQLLHGCVNEIRRTPSLMTSADVHHEVLEQLRSLQRVEHLGVELHAKYLLVLSRVCCKLHLVSACNAAESVGQGSDGVAVTHPHLTVSLKALEQWARGVYRRKIGSAVFAAVSRLHATSQCVTDELRTVAYSQHGHLADKLTEVHLESLWVVNAIGRTGQNDANHVLVSHWELVIRQNLAECVHFAQATSNQLCCLRTEVQNDNLFLHIV